MVNETSAFMDNILEWAVAVTILVTASSHISKLFNPYTKIVKRLDTVEKFLGKDKERLDKLETALEKNGDADKIICKSLLALLNHMISGEDLQKVKDAKSSLEEFLVDK